MNRIRSGAVIVVLAAIAACRDLPSSADSSSSDLAVAFASVPVGYSSVQSTYGDGAEGAGPFMPGERFGGLGRGPGRGMGHGMHDMIGGGLGPDFLGGPGIGFGFGFGHNHFGDPSFDSSTCTFNATSGRVECAAFTDRRGLTVTRSVQFTTAGGTVQQAFDSLTTNTVNTRVSVAGTVTRHENVTSVVDNSSNRTVSGLAPGSTQHTINGTAKGHETTTGQDSAGTFTVERIAADTVRDVVVPVSDSTHRHQFPTSGTVIRVMSVNITKGDGTTKSSSRREVITYDGSTIVRMVVKQDGTTRTCTLTLPGGRPTCE
ncbi:MAG TPA: hypothetical protein VE967_03450 [Gemmatimonadaceae bacterium]|nr:hypothetical protein [Gemmatimonadaceae bacterium]